MYMWESLANRYLFNQNGEFYSGGAYIVRKAAYGGYKLGLWQYLLCWWKKSCQEEIQNSQRDVVSWILCVKRISRNKCSGTNCSRGSAR